MQLHDCLMS